MGWDFFFCVGIFFLCVLLIGVFGWGLMFSGLRFEGKVVV